MPQVVVTPENEVGVINLGAYDEPMAFNIYDAVEYGLKGIIIIRTLKKLLRYEGRTIDGVKWVRQSYNQWQEKLPFFTKVIIRNELHRLEKAGYIRIGHFHIPEADDRWKEMDKCKWYTFK